MLRQFVISVVAFHWLVLVSVAAGTEPPDLQRGGPWLGQERSNAETALPEYFAMARSLEDGDFWVGFSCLGDKRVYLSLLKNDSEFSGPDGLLFSVEIRFDDGSPFTTDAKFVTSHVIAVNPEASKAVLVAVIHSQIIGVSISGNMKGGGKGSFGVQPYAPVLSKIIGACAISGEVFWIHGVAGDGVATRLHQSVDSAVTRSRLGRPPPSCNFVYWTMTQVGCSIGNATRPTAAVAAISSGLLFFHRNRTASEISWIVCPKATSTKPKIVTFRDWLLAEAADDARRLRKLFASKL